MQDTEYIHGCLSVMPKSHTLGPISHGQKVIEKRDLPSAIYDREVRYVEMKKGDLLLFHSCLLHSSSLNLSTVTRYSIQARYSPSHLPTDTGMGSIILL
jgi:ectoine hydroxylase-related dioxygenase (phytanoyl-CoA dioxygenase family)